MSIIFKQVIAQHGFLALTVGTDAPAGAVGSQGLLVDESGLVYATTVTPPNHFNAGLPFDLNGRLVVEDAPIDHYDQGLPFTASGALSATNEVSLITYNQGVPFGPNGGVAASGLTPPPTIVSLFGWSTFLAGAGPYFYRTDTAPWSQVSPIVDVLTSQGNSADFNATANLYAQGGGGASTPSHEVWDTTTFPFTKVLSASTGSFSGRAIRFTNDGTQMAVGFSSSGANRIYNTSNWTFWEADNEQVAAAAFNVNNDILVFANSTQGAPGMSVWDVSTVPGTPLSVPVAAPPGSNYACDFHPTENLLIIADASNMRLYDMDTFTLLGTRSTGGQAGSLRWSNGGDRLAFAGLSTPEVKVWDTTDLLNIGNWVLIETNNTPIGAYNTCIGWSDDDVYLASRDAGSVPVLFAWDTTTASYDRITDFDDGGPYSASGPQAVAHLTGITLPP